MKRSTLRGTAASLLCVGLLTTAGATVAQETRSQTQDEYSSSTTRPDQTTSTSTTTSSSRSSSDQHAVMKECVERERAGDSTMTESEARKACHDALRAERDNVDNEPQPPHQQ